jgi:hypothetical protein
MRLTLAHGVAGLALLSTLAAGCAAGAAHPVAHSPAPAHPASAHPAATHAAVTHQASPAATQSATEDMHRRHHRHHHHRAAEPVATSAPPMSVNPIPQGDGGDHDADNNGGPSDGDGNV